MTSWGRSWQSYAGYWNYCDFQSDETQFKTVMWCTESYTSWHFMWFCCCCCWNMLKTRFINFIWSDHSFIYTIATLLPFLTHGFSDSWFLVRRGRRMEFWKYVTMNEWIFKINTQKDEINLLSWFTKSLMGFNKHRSLVIIYLSRFVCTLIVDDLLTKVWTAATGIQIAVMLSAGHPFEDTNHVKRSIRFVRLSLSSIGLHSKRYFIRHVRHMKT